MELMLEEVLEWLQGLADTEGKSLPQIVEEGAMLDQVARVVNRGLRDVRARLRDDVDGPGVHEYDGELNGRATVEVKEPKLVLSEENHAEFAKALRGHVSPTMVFDRQVRFIQRPDALDQLRKIPIKERAKALSLLEQEEEAPRVQFHWED